MVTVNKREGDEREREMVIDVDGQGQEVRNMRFIEVYTWACESSASEAAGAERQRIVKVVRGNRRLDRRSDDENEHILGLRRRPCLVV